MLLTTINDKFNITKATPHKTIAEFCGVDSPNQVSNGDTIGHFRNLLEKYKLQEKLFDKVIEILTEKGLILKRQT